MLASHLTNLYTEGPGLEPGKPGPHSGLGSLSLSRVTWGRSSRSRWVGRPGWGVWGASGSDPTHPTPQASGSASSLPAPPCYAGGDLALALDDTPPVGPRVADQGTLASLAHFPSYAHQRPKCKGSSRDKRCHCSDDKDKA